MMLPILGAAVVLLLLLVLVRRILKAAAQSRMGLLLDLAREADLQSQLTPRSVSGGDRIFLPQILEDFPEFDAELAKDRIENEIRRIFTYLNGGADSPVAEVLDFARMLRQDLQQAKPSGVEIHRTAISNYVKSKDSAVIEFQTAFAYSVLGKREKRETRQERFSTRYTYFLSGDTLSDGQSGISLRCPYCGAPVVSTGSKVCEYCSSEIVVAQDRAWKIVEMNKK